MHWVSQFKTYYMWFAWVFDWFSEFSEFFVTDQSSNYLEFIFGFTIALIIYYWLMSYT